MEEIFLITDIDTKIPFSKRHPGLTIRQILRSDSGYIKDLFIHNRICFTPECLNEICKLTAKHEDNWSTPQIKPGQSIFTGCRPYKSSYLFNFNNDDLIAENEARHKQVK